MADNMIFQRYEKKYLLTKQQYDKLRERFADYMTADSYGKHTICNIYFDTDDFELIRTSIEKPVYKEKLRLRSYGIPSDNDYVFLEIKKKYDGIVYKRRVRMTLSEAREFLNNGIVPDESEQSWQTSQIYKELSYFIKYHKPNPKMYIAYDRIAMFGTTQNDLRITFDTNIRSRENKLDLSKGDFGEKLLSDDSFLMEIKAPGAIPVWLSNVLAEEKIYPTSFSKYGRIYGNKLESEIQNQITLNKIHTIKEIKKCLQAY